MKKIPGLVLVLIIVFISRWMSDLLSTWILLEPLTVSIILGILTANTVQIPKLYTPGISFSLKKVLKYGIVLLGFKLQFQTVVTLGPTILGLVVLFVPFVLIVSFFLGKVFGLNKKLATLIGVGSSICGASAVVALVPVINAKEEDGLLAVSVVSLLGSIGVILYVFLTTVLRIDPLVYGVWSGLSLHGVAHALAAAFGGGEVAGEIGTIVKMTRVLMLVPVSVVLSRMFNTDSKSVRFPIYILLFIVVASINSFEVIPDSITDILRYLSSIFIMMAMTAMGLSVKFKELKQSGLKAVLVGSVLFVITSVIALISSILVM